MLNEDMNMKVTVTKYHLFGSLKCVTTTEKMTFLNWDHACYFAGGVSKNPEIPYVVLDMINPVTGKKECAFDYRNLQMDRIFDMADRVGGVEVLFNELLVRMSNTELREFAEDMESFYDELESCNAE
jgi:hypothetical protein